MSQPTKYQLACGDVDRFTLGGHNVTLWQEHGVYHVRWHNHNTQRRMVWLSFRTLTEARKALSRARRLLRRRVKLHPGE